MHVYIPGFSRMDRMACQETVGQHLTDKMGKFEVS